MTDAGEPLSPAISPSRNFHPSFSSPGRRPLHPRRSDIAAGAQADLPAATHDDVVVQRHPQSRTGLLDLLCHCEIGGRRLGISGWMVVHDDQRRGVERQATPQHFPGIDRGMINCAYGQTFVRDEPVLPVEIEDMEALDITPDGQRAIVQNRLPCG